MAPRTPYNMLLAPMPSTPTEPQRSALVIIDGQLFTTSREHGLGAAAAERGIAAELAEYFRQTDAAVANIARLARAFRARGSLVVHSLLSGGPRLSRHLQASRLPLPSPADLASCICPAIGAREGDLVLARGTYGPFAAGDLNAALDARRIERVFLAGMPANLTVALAAREAADRDYRVVVVQDATASETMEWHSLTMLGLAGGAIRIAWTDEAIEMLDGTRT